MAFPALIAALAPVFGQVLDRVLPDKGARDAAERELTAALLAHAGEIERAGAEIVLAEARSEHPLTSTWRPLLMLVIAAVIANNYLLAPYLQALFGLGLTLELPERLWDLLTLGVGGYVVGRSGEKMVKSWKGAG